MKLSKLAGLIALVATFSISSFASTAPSTNTLTMPKSLSDIFKKERLGLSLYSSVGHRGGTTDFTGYSQTNIGYLSYKMTNTDSLRLENRWSISNPNGESAEHTYSRMVLKYSKSGLLNQNDHGVNLSAALEKRYYPDASMRSSRNEYGLNRLSASFSRKMNDTLSLGATAYVALIDRINKDVDTTARNYLYLVMTQSIDLGKGLSLTFVEEVFKNNNKANSDEANSFDLTVELGKSLTDKLSGTISVAGSPIFSTSKSWKVDSSFTKNLSYGASLYYAAF